MGRRSRRRLKDEQSQSAAPQKKGKWERFHDKHYKMLIFIPFFIGLLSLISILVLYSATGDFIHRGISLRGGTSLTFTTNVRIDAAAFEAELSSAFSGEEFAVRELETGGEVTGLVVETSLRGDSTDELVRLVGQRLGVSFSSDDYTVEEMGSTLGESFFADLLKTLLFAFLLMGIVVFYYFRSVVPSSAVVFSAFLDLIITLGIINLIGVRLSTAGIAAFLMIFGYCIDTSVLLTTRVTKRSAGTSIYSAMVDSLKTGLTMTACGLSSSIVGYFVSESPVIKQIMLILIIGFFVDMMTTWIENAGLLRWYVEHKEAKAGGLSR